MLDLLLKNRLNCVIMNDVTLSSVKQNLGNTEVASGAKPKGSE